MMKKYVIVLIAVLMLSLLVACGDTAATKTPGTSTITPTPETVAETPPPSETEDATPELSGEATQTGENPPASYTKEALLEIIGDIYSGARETLPRAERYFTDGEEDMFYEGELESGSDRYFGTAIDFKIAVFSTSNMQPDPFFMCLIVPNDDKDTEGIITAIKDNADLGWQICVCADKLETAEKDGYILMIMGSKEETETLKNSFLALNLA